MNFIILCVYLLTILYSSSVGGLEDHVADHSRLFAKDMEEVFFSNRKRNVRICNKTGYPVAVYGPNFVVEGNTPEKIARHFSQKNRAKNILQLDIDKNYGSNLELESFRETGIWTTLRLRQTYAGIPVYKSQVAVTVDNQTSEVKMITSSFTNGVKLGPIFGKEDPTQKPKHVMSKTDVIQVVTSRYPEEKSGSLRMFESKAVIFRSPNRNSFILAWEVIFAKKNDIIEIEVIIDDISKEIVQETVITLDKKGDYSDLKGDEIISRHRYRPVNGKKKTMGVRGISDSGTTETLEHRESTNSIDSATHNISSESTLLKSMLSTFTPLEWICEFSSLALDYLITYWFTATVSPSSSPSSSSLMSAEQPTSSSFSSPTSSPTPDTLIKIAVGNVFDPDPISSGNGKYGVGGFVDGDDVDSKDLTDQLKEYELRDLKYYDGEYHLEGPYATIVDTGLPHTGSFAQTSERFTFTRSQQGFEAVNCYYHLDSMMRYVNEVLGIKLKPFMYEGGLKFDPHGAMGRDNSFYSFSGYLEFGEGGVDDAEDPEVIIHELGHAFHHWLTFGSISQVNGLSEGFGDYLAMSYSRSKNMFSRFHENYHSVFKWDGHNEFWGGRTTDYNRRYPKGLTGSTHADGQIWSSCNMRIWDFLGREKSDKAHLLGISSTTSNSNQEDVANAILQAASSLGYSQTELDGMRRIYANCGYEVSNDVCGDGVLGLLEECEPGKMQDLGGATCATSASGCRIGTPRCRRDCTIDYSGCAPGDDQTLMELKIRTDHYGVETTWDVVVHGLDGVIASGGPYGSNEEVKEKVCLETSRRCYDFRIRDAESDGMCCRYGRGSYTLTFDGVEIADTNPHFGELATHTLCMRNLRNNNN